MTPTVLPIGEVFAVETWWIQVIKALILALVGFSLIPAAVTIERKLLGRFQHRYGPNRAGPYGTLQAGADILKLLGKENFRPNTSGGFLFYLAPMLAVIAAVATFAIIPFGNVVTIFGQPVGLYGIDVGIGPLYLFALGSIAFYGLVLGGFSSGSKYSYLGAMRAAAQLISYEVSMGLALVGVIMATGSLSLVDIVEYQREHTWFIVTQFVGFLVFVIAAMAETNRAPFDLVEADSEIVAGYMTEYGGGGFASFYAAEYLNMVVAGAIATTIFLGGWAIPFWGYAPDWLGPIVVLVKTFLFVVFFVWVRATLPRLRYDQLMSFGWKILLPLATLNALVTAVVVVVA
ncbi:MAG: NADH-quinone oxidoreductase subunit NuoH [Patulibacter minatonensis]